MRIDRKQVRFGLIIVGVVSVFVVGLLGPLEYGMSRVREKIVEAEDELGIVKGHTDGLVKLAYEVDELREQVNRTNKVIPKTDKMPSMLSDVCVQIEHRNLDKQDMNTGTVTKTDEFVSMPIALKIDGSSGSVFEFIGRLEEMTNLVQITSVVMISNPGISDVVHAEVCMTAFFSDSLEGGP